MKDEDGRMKKNKFFISSFIPYPFFIMEYLIQQLINTSFSVSVVEHALAC